MDTDELRCRKCNDTVFEAAKRGAYLRRVNPMGEDFIGECRPSCDIKCGDQDTALINAIEDAN